MSQAVFFGEVELTSTNNTITNGSSSSTTITAGDYYIYYPVDAYSLIYQVTTALTSVCGKTVTASISDAGKLTLSASSSFNWSIGCYAYLGFSSSSGSSASSYTASSYLPYCFFSGQLTTSSLAPISRKGIIVSEASQTISPDSTSYTSLWASHYRQDIGFKYLSKAKTWNASYDYSSLEEFYGNTLSTGRKFVFLPEYSSTTYYHVYVANLGEMNQFNPGRDISSSDTYWNFNMSLWGA